MKVFIRISRAVLLGSFLAHFVVFMIISQNVGGTISRSQEHDLILSHSFGSPSAPDQLPTWVLFLNTHLETTMNLVDLEISFALALAAFPIACNSCLQRDFTACEMIEETCGN